MPMKPRFTRCRSCRALVFWAETSRGKRMLVDEKRVAEGNVKVTWRELYDEPLAIVLGSAGLALAQAEHKAALEQGLTDEPELMLHTSHFATCPDAERWRRSSHKQKAKAA
jgi:hypothetical protein